SELSQVSQRLGTASYVGEDARALPLVEDGSVGLIITSPPYAGAQKYVRATSLSLGWLKLATVAQLRTLEQQTIGREHFSRKIVSVVARIGSASADKSIARIYRIDPVRATIVAAYLAEMKQAMQEMYRVLKSGGYLVLIVGNNQVCGSTFPTSKS